MVTEIAQALINKHVILAHELFHIVDYAELGPLGMIGLGLTYGLEKDQVLFNTRRDFKAFGRFKFRSFATKVKIARQQHNFNRTQN